MAQKLEKCHEIIFHTISKCFEWSITCIQLMILVPLFDILYLEKIYHEPKSKSKIQKLSVSPRSINCWMPRISEKACQVNWKGFVRPSENNHGGWQVHKPRRSYEANIWVQLFLWKIKDRVSKEMLNQAYNRSLWIYIFDDPNTFIGQNFPFSIQECLLKLCT